MRMLLASLAGQVIPKTASLEEAAALIWKYPQVCEELVQLVDVLETRVSHLQMQLESFPEVPLQVHARYSRLEILAAFDVGEAAKISAWQSGVYWVAGAKADLLAFTLDKTSGSFSPTTRYRDYAISPELIH